MFDLDTVTPLNFLVKHLGSCSLSELNIFLPQKTMVGTQRIFFKILLFSSISFMEGRKFLEKKNLSLNPLVERGDFNQYITFFTLKI
jgi:hypothetical protein